MFLFTVLFLIFIYFEDPWLVADKISSKQEMYDKDTKKKMAYLLPLTFI